MVDLEERTCAFGSWELIGIPCSHVVAVIKECRNKHVDYVDNFYRVDTYLMCYDHIINPINGKNLWSQLDDFSITFMVYSTTGKKVIEKKEASGGRCDKTLKRKIYY